MDSKELLNIVKNICYEHDTKYITFFFNYIRKEITLCYILYFFYTMKKENDENTDCIKCTTSNHMIIEYFRKYYLL